MNTNLMLHDSEDQLSYKSIIYKLEMLLLTRPAELSKDKISSLISDDFYEFGSSGKIWRKPDLVKLLPSQEPFEGRIDDFRVLALSSTIFLATYKLSGAKRTSLRPSIWRLENNSWQMVFHQGTPIG
jgi:hypothetical protein